jgi:hypothetical protein
MRNFCGKTRVQAPPLKETEQLYTEQQIPSSEQPVHLMMAG